MFNSNHTDMINPNDTAYLLEKEDFYSDKCPHCMGYVNDQNECPDNFCEGKLFNS